MPIGYLVTVAVMAVMTVLAVAPPVPSASRPMHWTYALGGFLVNEVPFLALYWLSASTALAASSGDLRHPVGIAAASLAVGTAGGLVVVARRGLATRAQLSGGLDDALGPNALPSAQPWWRILVAPFPWRGPHVRRTANVAYGDRRRNRLDVYHHRTKRGGPVLVYFHGGGFRSGRKNREAKPLLHRLSRRGWVCISANYRLAPAAHFPDPLVDARLALAWARRHAADYGGDPSRIYVAGSSAGGHLATMCALDVDVDGPDPPDAAGAPVAGAIILYGFFGSPDSHWDRPATPHAHVHRHAPPFFIAHGDHDTLVVVDDARHFVHDLAATSENPVVYAELRHGQHGFDLVRSARFEAVVDAVEVFLSRQDPVAPATVDVG